MVASAARRRDRRNLVVSSTASFPASSSILKPALSHLALLSPVNDHCHGQLYSAATVNVVSKQLDNDRVEQNHCQGLRTVNASAAHA